MLKWCLFPWKNIGERTSEEKRMILSFDNQWFEIGDGKWSNIRYLLQRNLSYILTFTHKRYVSIWKASQKMLHHWEVLMEGNTFTRLKVLTKFLLSRTGRLDVVYRDTYKKLISFFLSFSMVNRFISWHIIQVYDYSWQINVFIWRKKNTSATKWQNAFNDSHLYDVDNISTPVLSCTLSNHKNR